ncbi:hypothetical protein IB286_11595 [Spongiibacter sp. KMU-158]|uniref:Uncharacterized protein n=1 Tax=Spongiibacter pelagi TaxID=2760804 RepID=A0A927C1P3_9GAMM|nr:hypothetical protein [Spongiibacter pelagi]MBD2859648.1 hypothetical protein [Spongiibacter pelagi]
MSQAFDNLSTSALARELGLPLQQLFSTLQDYGWISKLEDGWALTGKGEFEGGRYVNSKRYGRYIVWPKTLLEHPLLQALEHIQMLSSSALGRELGISSRQVNRLLLAMGVMVRAGQGWRPTPLGLELGAQSVLSQDSGMTHLLWPESFAEHPGLIRLSQASKPLELVEANTSETALGDDLFAEQAKAPVSFQGLDGHTYYCQVRWQLAQWLYLAGLRYAKNALLPLEQELRADFYLPDWHIFIECWGGQETPSALSKRLERQSVYAQHGLHVVDVHSDELPQLDDVLGRRLADLNVDFY